MEIYSYVGSQAERKRISNFVSLLNRPGNKKSFHQIKAEPVSKINFRIALKKLGEFLWVIPCIAAAFLLSFCIYKAYGYFQNYAFPLVLQGQANEELDLLDKAMANFALDKTEYADSEGNVSDVPAPAKFTQPVSYVDYTVKAGETISGITRKFGLTNISTIIAVNKIENVRQVYSGQKLKVPNFDGLIYTVKAGNTIEGISAKYHVPVEDLLDVNDLDSLEISAGTELFIPGARLDRDTLRRALGEVWTCPILAKWRLTSRCGWRTDPVTGLRKQYHNGLDMACPEGTPIYAPLGGRVIASGWSNLYGNYLIIDHSNGYHTLYGHLSKKISRKGDYVAQGTKIGLVGSTGYSTGPHLHFTVYKNNSVIDPLTVLK